VPLFGKCVNQGLVCFGAGRSFLRNLERMDGLKKPPAAIPSN
jgi:hypothetical protein